MLDRPADMGPRVVSHRLNGYVLGPEGVKSLELLLQYHSTAPYAVTARFHEDGTAVSWSFGRDLLRHGIYEPAGAGDVHVRPDLDGHGRAVVRLELSSPHGAAIVMVPARDVHRFVVAMTNSVRPGTESHHLDIDAAIAVLVGGPPD